VPNPIGECECLPTVVACEDTFYPQCDGDCPPGQICTQVPGTDNCHCEPLPPPLCEDTFYPVCNGSCPPNRVCVKGPTPIDPCECHLCIIAVPWPHIEIAWPTKIDIHWSGSKCATKWNLYRATVPRLVDADRDGLADDYGTCFRPDLMVPQTQDASGPPTGQMHIYLVTGENAVGEGSLGFTSSRQERPNRTPCP